MASHRALCRDQPPVDEKSDRPQLLTTEGNGTDRQQDAATDRTTPNGWGIKVAHPVAGAVRKRAWHTWGLHPYGQALTEAGAFGVAGWVRLCSHGAGVLRQGLRRDTCRQVTAGSVSSTIIMCDRGNRMLRQTVLLRQVAVSSLRRAVTTHSGMWGSFWRRDMAPNGRSR
ncbi:hypothetical protein [Pectobacterium odoriferum]|uniref:hypothetical protein n=1 Tax=Pectobacterium odoriferum TaxID=78398 RepID=UPI0011AF1F9A|nr:hypothetical protein [Pectobacterium odoriferum]